MDRDRHLFGSPDDTWKYHFQIGRYSRNSRIINLISEMADFDSHVPPAIPAQYLPGLILAAFRGWMSVTTRFQMPQLVQSWVAQPVRRPMRWSVR